MIMLVLVNEIVKYNITCVSGRKEMFYLTTHLTHLYGVGYMVKDNSYGLLFYMHQHTERIAHTTAFVTPVVEHWL